MLTVAVSVSSGVQNAKSALPFIEGHEAWVAAGAVLILMALNLRGVRESGTLFAIPTYCFMIAIIGMVALGAVPDLRAGQRRSRPHSAQYGIEGDESYTAFTGFVMVALLARAFSSGCAALTGVEAISNGVPAFKKPKSKNAATTLLLLGTISVTMLIGVITLANLTGLKLIDEGHSHYTLNGERVEVVEETAIGQLARAVFAGFPPGFYFVIAATMIILFLAANTAFNGFPVLGSILARDGYLPRQLLHPRRPAGLQQRDRRAGRGRDRPDRGLPGRRDRADPALRGRRLRLLHGQPDSACCGTGPGTSRPRRIRWSGPG